MRETRVQKLEGDMTIDYTRQRGWHDPSGSNARVTLVGCGGIGSPTAISLSKFGIPYLTLVDPDVVEAHNVPNQMYPITAVGRSKVGALKSLCEVFGPSEVTALQKRIEEVPEVLNNPYVICGLDSMEARQTVWDILQEHPEWQTRWLIDGRISGLNWQLYTIDLHDAEKVEMYMVHGLFPDSEKVEDSCTERAIIHIMLDMAKEIQKQLFRILNDRPYDPVVAAETEKNVIWRPYDDSTEGSGTAPREAAEAG